MRLPPLLYRFLQWLVHGDYEETRAAIDQWYAPHSGRPVLELGCGTGTFARFFPAGAYTGVDMDGGRIGRARVLNPHARFEAADATALSDEFVRGFPLIFTFNFFHHLSEEQCARVFQTVDRSASEDGTLMLVGEPVLPRFWSNPIGYLLAKADDGDFVRSMAETQRLFSRYLLRVTPGKTKLIWPVPGAWFELRLPGGIRDRKPQA